MGFGLFVPQFKSTFEMSTSTVGFVSSFGFSGFFLGLLIAQLLVNRLGPGAPVLTGLCAASTGMGIVALAPDPKVLAGGVFLAASSAGFAWTPFNNAVHRKIRDVDRPEALSEISTGTSVGIMAAGFAALVMVLSGISWRSCWAFFAIVSIGALVLNWASFRNVESDPGEGPKRGWRALMQFAVIPMFDVAFIYGTTSSIYISFAPDYMLDSGGVSGLTTAATPALMFIFYGFFGLTGLATGRARDVIGLPGLLRLILLAGAISMALCALWPANWVGLISSAGLQGIHVMMTSAVLAFWSERLFPALPSLSFTATLLAMAAGSMLGPAIAGVASDAFGAGAMFLGAAALPAATALFLRGRHVQESPALNGAPEQS